MTEAARVRRRLALMGTYLEVAVAARSRKSALAASERAVAEIERVEALLSTRRAGSPLARLNAAPVGRFVPLEAEVFGALHAAFGWRRRTRGAFDPAVGAGRLRFSRKRRAVARLHDRVSVLEGAWGKGYALDRAAEVLDARSIDGAVMNLGGHVHVVGEGLPALIVEIADPRDRRRAVAALRLAEGSVSTSGDSERPRHLLDPRSGRPARDFGSVTVTASSALIADVLSTAFFVLGPARGGELSDGLRRRGVAHETLFLIARRGHVQGYCSNGFPLLGNLSGFSHSKGVVP